MKSIYIFIVLIIIFITLTGCTDNSDKEMQIIPIEEGNYWIYMNYNSHADTLHYEAYSYAGPDSLGGWYWVCWSSYEDDPPFILAKNLPEGCFYHWVNELRNRSYKYDIMGRRYPDENIDRIVFRERPDSLEYYLYKYPVHLDEEWVLMTLSVYDEEANYICDVNYKGKYEMSEDIEVESGYFNSLCYTYFFESADPDVELTEYLDESFTRSYCAPDIGFVLSEHKEFEEDWEVYNELIQFHVE